MFPPVHNTEINPKRESVEQKGASVWTVVIVGLVISWLWGHNTVVHTVVVDSHTSFPALRSVSMEKLLCCSHCRQAASPLPRLLYVPQNRGKSRIKALLSPRLRPYWGRAAGCFHCDVSCNLGFGLHQETSFRGAVQDLGEPPSVSSRFLQGFSPCHHFFNFRSHSVFFFSPFCFSSKLSFVNEFSNYVLLRLPWRWQLHVGSSVAMQFFFLPPSPRES